MSDVHGKRGRWIDMLQNFNFKILHRPRLKHTNVDALSRNPVGKPRMMMISVKKYRILGLYKWTHLKQRKIYYLFNMVKIHTGLVSGDMQGN
jgi:hypothetical protein